MLTATGPAPTKDAAADLKPALASIDAARRYLGNISRSGFYASILPHLESVRLGTRHFVTIASLDDYIAAHRNRR
jgi:hypothetical protein